MYSKKVLTAIDTHTAGEAARLIIGGIPKFPGHTMAEKRAYLETHHDDWRCQLMHEPRGHHDMFGAFICEPSHDEADYGIIFMDTGGYLNMCGHNTIAAMTAAVETGWIDVEEGKHKVEVVQDTPAGIIKGEVDVDEIGQAKSVSFENVPSFVYKENVTITVPEIGDVTLDIAFGGSFFAILPISEIGLSIDPSNSEEIIKIGMCIRDILNKDIQIQHPTLSHIKTVDLVEFYEDIDINICQNVVVFGDGQIDRSPCGTGTSAKLATLYSKGKISKDDVFTNKSILNTTFTGEVVDTFDFHGYQAIIPRITGSAHITGFNTFLFDARDPLNNGFTLE